MGLPVRKPHWMWTDEDTRRAEAQIRFNTIAVSVMCVAALLLFLLVVALGARKLVGGLSPQLPPLNPQLSAPEEPS